MSEGETPIAAAVPPAEVPPLVRVSDLRKVFDVSASALERMMSGAPRRLVTAVDHVTFEIGRGETFALVGESGSGKSTVARMVVGLLERSAGRVTIDGTAVDDPATPRAERQALRRKIQMIFQDPYASLNPRWTVGRIVAEPVVTFGVLTDSRAIERRVGELLALVGLAPADRVKYPHQFSGGQRQRIAIARALSAEPAFIVCDEPTSALDVSVQAQILNLMADLQDRLGLTYLFISHNLAVVRHMADRIGVLYLGRLVEVRPARALFDDPRHPYTRMLIEAVPDLEAPSVVRDPARGEIPNPIDPPTGCHFHPRCPHVVERCRREVPALLDGVACHRVADGSI
ncbi:ATP-binding cassette domain-containing protein [Siculibacillus lacustris]|uniref:ATP-binding cassette domain-containing protein n=1 Tax=Siculibacillus lacustris TaxID=1549641 RepID=A0A4V2KT76_9HYPH|nr:oligopeptide/dipeptide ABC transporter ATP-binding protein [Siculibacillus lacustris]TBW36108.1 ATP-binding cassette domain-containing protein [Siculibacillus lacustris]